MELRVRGIPTDQVERIRSGAPDANGHVALVRVAEGPANPCRHCLGLIEEGRNKLVLSYRPFAEPQPYAETGPIFLHEKDCPHYDSAELPLWFEWMDPAVVRGYGSDDWIRYETGTVVAGRDIAATCRSILADESVAYVHVRSKFNCFQCRVDRA